MDAILFVIGLLASFVAAVSSTVVIANIIHIESGRRTLASKLGLPEFKRLTLAQKSSLAPIGFGGLLAWAVPYAGLMIILGLIMLLWSWKGPGKQSTKSLLMVIGIPVLVIGFVAGMGWDIGDGGGGDNFCPDGQTLVNGVCVGNGGAKWLVQVPNTVQGGGRDADTEIFNDGTGSEFSLDCVGDTPDGTLDASATNMFVTRPSNSIMIQYTVDNDAATSAAAYNGPDCHSNDFFVQPEHPIDINNDGAIDNQMLWMRVSSISRTLLKDNDSHTPAPTEIFFYTTTQGFYVGFMAEDADQAGSGQVLSACKAGIGKTSFSLSDCGWVFVGDTTSAGFYVAFQFLIDSNTGWWGYENGAIGDTESMSIQFGHGSGSSVVVDATWTYTMQLIARD